MATADHPGDQAPSPQDQMPEPPPTLIPWSAVIEAPTVKPATPRLWSPGEEQRRIKEERLYALMTHLLAVAANFLIGPVFGFAPPLVLLILKGKDSPFITHHAKESMNYQIMVAILSFLFGTTFGVLFVGGVVLGFTVESKPLVIGYWSCLIGAGLLGVLLQLYALLMVTLACIKSYHGEWFRYPFLIRLVK